MLILTRKKNEEIEIDNGRIKVVVVDIMQGKTGDAKVRLGIEAPFAVPVHRAEVARKIEDQTGDRWAKEPLMGFSLERRRGYYRYFYQDNDGSKHYIVYKIQCDFHPVWPRIVEATVVSLNSRDPDPHERLALDVVWESSIRAAAEGVIAQKLAAAKEASL